MMKVGPPRLERLGGHGLFRTARVAAILVAAVAIAAGPCAAAARVALTLAAGDTYVIHDLKPGAAPVVSVIENPHAIILNGDTPGQLILLGAENGRWDITVTRRDGSALSYDVRVEALKDFKKPLAPGQYPDDSSAAPDRATATAAARAADSPGPLAQGDASASPPAPSQTTAPGVTAVKYQSDPQAEFSPMGEGSGGAKRLPDDAIEIMAGSSQLFEFPHAITRVAIADTKVADVEGITPYQINVIGRAPGFTTLDLWNDQGDFEQREVRIDSTGAQQVLLKVIVAELNRTKIENQGVNLSVALSHIGLSLVGLPGPIATSYSPESQLTGTTVAGIGATAFTPAQGVLTPSGSLIPMLLSPAITYALAAGNSNVDTQTFFQFLEQHGLGRILAEPHLLATSGQQAKFLSGGEIPIVLAQALNTSIVFKKFGTSVRFVPTVIGRDEISLVVQPEVSQPDFTHGVQLFGFAVPAFVTRRADTTVRLRSNQSLIIAGLILHNKLSTVDKVPYLGDVPYLGGLFRHTEHSNQETDLVMSVTPEIVRPLPPGAAIALPTQRGPLTRQEIKTTRLTVPDASRPRF